jgi:hypothetical protein
MGSYALLKNPSGSRILEEPGMSRCKVKLPKQFFERYAEMGFRPDHLDDLLSSLFHTSAMNPHAHSGESLDHYGVPRLVSSITRVLNDMLITLEDRGLVCAIWVKKIDPNGGTRQVIWWEEFRWDEVLDFSKNN